MNKLVIMLISTASIALSACDPHIAYSKYIENNSDYDIMVHISSDTVWQNPFEYRDSMLITKHSEVLIGMAGRFTKKPYEETCETYADSIKADIIDNDNLKLTLDLNNSSNWIFGRESTKYKDRGRTECRIVITNADIQ